MKKTLSCDDGTRIEKERKKKIVEHETRRHLNLYIRVYNEFIISRFSE